MADSPTPPADNADGAATGTSTVRLELPAHSAYLAILRSVVGNLAARHDFTVEEIDDLRMAVDEAGSLLLEAATDTLDAVFTLGTGRVDTTLSARTSPGFGVDRDSFGWTLLAALVEDVAVDEGDGPDETVITIRAATAQDLTGEAEPRP